MTKLKEILMRARADIDSAIAQIEETHECAELAESKSRFENALTVIYDKMTDGFIYSPTPEQWTALETISKAHETIETLVRLLLDIKRFDIENLTLDLPVEIRARIEKAITNETR